MVKTRSSVSAAVECPKVNNQFVQYSKEALSQAKVAAIVAAANLPPLTGSVRYVALSVLVPLQAVQLADMPAADSHHACR